MSLSPQAFATSLGSAGVEDESGMDMGSVLVYRDRVVGKTPSGCDGWPVFEDASLQMMTVPEVADGKDADGLYQGKYYLFPPCWGSGKYDCGDPKVSHELYLRTQAVRNSVLAAESK